MPRFKIQPSVTGSLCARCERGHVYERKNGHVVAICAIHCEPVQVPLDIVKCTDFQDRKDVSRREMEVIAWQIRHDRSGAILGFKPPKKKVDDD